MSVTTKPKPERLPAAYDKFSNIFGQMDAPLMSVIGGVLRALSGRDDAPGAFENQPDGEFAGYDGLENRGRLGNLLESEWLLRELDADDFVRRVAEGEVLYRKRDFKGTGTSNTLAVVLDCGAWMLGRNRLVALASLFYLAQRAARRGDNLHWIVPGGRREAWQDTLTRDSVSAYLDRIVQSPLTEDMVDRALTKLEIEGELDLWYVGARQTEAVLEHPGIGSAILVGSNYTGQVNKIDLDLLRHRRRIMQVQVTLPDDDVAVAALRRPFKPEVAKTLPSKPWQDDGPVLSALPFRTSWLLDRHNHAVLIRMPQGVLWQPLQQHRSHEGVWFPTRPNVRLLGIQAQRNGTISAMTAKPFDKAADQGVTLCQIKLHNFGLNDGKWVQGLAAQTDSVLDLEQIHPLAMGNLNVTPHLAELVTKVGARLTWDLSKEKTAQSLKLARNHVLFCDGLYRIELSPDDVPDIRVLNVSRNTELLTESTNHPRQMLIGKPMHLLFSPSAKVLALSLDAQTYRLYGTDGNKTVTVPDDLTLIGIENSIKAMAWNRKTSDLVQLHFWGDHTHQKILSSHSDVRTRHPRFCPLTGTVFAVDANRADLKDAFVPIVAKRGWDGIKPLAIMDAIERAPTKWLEG